MSSSTPYAPKHNLGVSELLSRVARHLDPERGLRRGTRWRGPTTTLICATLPKSNMLLVNVSDLTGSSRARSSTGQIEHLTRTYATLTVGLLKWRVLHESGSDTSRTAYKTRKPVRGQSHDPSPQGCMKKYVLFLGRGRDSCYDRGVHHFLFPILPLTLKHLTRTYATLTIGLLKWSVLHESGSDTSRTAYKDAKTRPWAIS